MLDHGIEIEDRLIQHMFGDLVKEGRWAESRDVLDLARRAGKLTIEVSQREGLYLLLLLLLLLFIYIYIPLSHYDVHFSSPSLPPIYLSRPTPVPLNLAFLMEHGKKL